jgi:hypothetical protein
MRTEIVASLEGMKVVVKSDECELHEYDFAANAWRILDARHLPLPSEVAERWLQGWNRVDHSEALKLLTTSLPD